MGHVEGLFKCGVFDSVAWGEVWSPAFLTVPDKAGALDLGTTAMLHSHWLRTSGLKGNLGINPPQIKTQRRNPTPKVSRLIEQQAETRTQDFWLRPVGCLPLTLQLHIVSIKYDCPWLQPLDGLSKQRNVLTWAPVGTCRVKGNPKAQTLPGLML